MPRVVMPRVVPPRVVLPRLSLGVAPRVPAFIPTLARKTAALVTGMVAVGAVVIVVAAIGALAIGGSALEAKRAPAIAEVITDADLEDEADIFPPLKPIRVVYNAPEQLSRNAAIFKAALRGGDGPPKPGELRSLWSADSVGDETLKDLVLWARILDEREQDWPTVKSFLLRRPNWPGGAAFQSRVEWRMPESADRAERIAFFTASPPITARGHRLFGEALIAAGRADEGEKWIVSGWRERTGNPKEEELFLKKHGALLTPHHQARFETLIWRKRVKAAERVAKKLPAGWIKLAKAVAALHRNSRGVDKLIGAVPQTLREHPSLVYARMKWRERKRRRSDAEKALLSRTADTLGAPEAWADERLAFSRDAFEDKREKDAASLASAHGLSSGRFFAALEFFAGWVRLRSLDDSKGALSHFSRMWAGVVTPISRSRGAYWAGRAAEASGDADLAKLWYGRAAEHPEAFYGQLAAEKLGLKPSFKEPDGARVGLDAALLSAEERDLALAAAALYRAGEADHARAFLETLAKLKPGADGAAAITELARRWRDPKAEILAAKAAFASGAPLWSSLYPTPDQPRFTGRTAEAALLLAIGRQESRFSAIARSGAGARGLMQVMPSTGRAAARLAKTKFSLDRLSSDAEYNLSLADAHLASVLRNYKGSYLLAVAAYNAGEGNVAKWIARFGDPRDPNVDPVDWIESIPFAETRNYVQRVLEGVQVYRVLLGEAETIALTSDLNR